jgi:hypothetical protein
MRPWHLGNTTVRSPFRLREGLIALSTSPLRGNLRGREQEQAFRALLGQSGVVELGSDVSYSVGRKWRSALAKLGFLYPEVPATSSATQDQIGQRDGITENGKRLIEAETVPGMQECFLRSLAAYFIPSLTETAYKFPPFSPLRHTLAILLELDQQGHSSRLGFTEMALIVQLSTPQEGVNTIVERILALRAKRDVAQNKRAFDRGGYEAAAEEHKYAASTFSDYADTNFRYLKATGLVQTKGRGITLVPEKRVLSERLVADQDVPGSDVEYLKRLCSGATLPTDNRDEAMMVLEDLIRLLKERKIAFDIGLRPTVTAADVAVLRHQAEELLFQRNEEEYADRQVAEWEEIAGYMEMLSTRQKRKTLANGQDITIPQAEAPAYFEWALWRAFLAIDSLTIPPYAARRFKVDQDFLPVSPAPGNGADLVLEFADFVLAVEVTLTENSRQEAAEGEPVRRHVADLVQAHKDTSKKRVYGMFLANRIDSNTAETFRRGSWYDAGDNELRLDIVPMTLAHFNQFFQALFVNKLVDAQRVRLLLEACSDVREAHRAPAWKQSISTIIETHARGTGQAT